VDGEDTDGSDCEDGRDYVINKIDTTTGQVVQPTTDLYVLARRPLNKRFYEQKCPEGTGVNPYNSIF
jgi:hypothetical protein